MAASYLSPCVRDVEPLVAHGLDYLCRDIGRVHDIGGVDGFTGHASRRCQRTERFAFAAWAVALRKRDARLHGARAECGHTHRGARELPRERLRERDDRVFRRRVDAVVLTSNPPIEA